jgi:hypothetical protein
MNSPRAIAILTCLCACAFAVPQVTRQGERYRFQLNLKAGQTVRYEVRASMTVPGQSTPIAVTQMLRQRVMSVTNGIARLQVSSSTTVNLPNTQPITSNEEVRVDRLGRVVGGIGQAQGISRLPANPVRVGDTWSAGVPLGPASGNTRGNANVTFRFLGMKRLEGRDLAEVAITIKSAASVQMTGEGRGYILASDGTPFRLSIKGRTTGPGSPQPMDFTMTLRRP